MMQRLTQALLLWLLVDFARAEEEQEVFEHEEGGGEGEEEEQELPEVPDVVPQLSKEQLEGLFLAMDKNKAGRLAVADLDAFIRDMRLHRMSNDDGSYFKGLDQNSDGKVALDEILPHPDMMGSEDDHNGENAEHEDHMADYQGHEKAKFTAADKNKDGFLDSTEFGAFEWPEIDQEVEEAYARSIFNSKDKDKDGSLTIEEFFSHMGEELPKEDFSKLDKNGDGKLSLDEVKAWESGRHFAEQALADVANTADTDKDGFITLEEFVAIKTSHGSDYYLHDWATQLEL